MPWAAELKEKQGHDHSVELVSSGSRGHNICFSNSERTSVGRKLIEPLSQEVAEPTKRVSRIKTQVEMTVIIGNKKKPRAVGGLAAGAAVRAVHSQVLG